MVNIRPAGPEARLVEVADAEQAVDLAGWLRERLEAVEVVPGACTVLLDGLGDPESLELLLADWYPGTAGQSGELVEISVTYDGADLDDVADRWGTDRAGVIARHQAQVYVAAFTGFAPGFAYLAGLPEELSVPRLATPRTRVPVGAVGLADTWCGVYPTESPGGWRLLGTTTATLWDVERPSPATLPPGTRVRFVSA